MQKECNINTLPESEFMVYNSGESDCCNAYSEVKNMELNNHTNQVSSGGKGIRLTTLCYLEQDGKYLMLYRNKKEGDQSEGKYLGVGGKLERGESPEECALREIREETGFEVSDLTFRGIVTFISDVWEHELMFLYSAGRWTGTLRMDCSEGELLWVPKEQVLSLPAWQGDKYFLRKLLDGDHDIHLKLVYEGEQLTEAYDNGSRIVI